MNAELSRLGVPLDIQAFFNLSAGLSFDYGNDKEEYAEGLYRVPTTKNLWFAGTVAASNVVVSYSALEMVAFLTLNRHRYTDLNDVAFIAIGNRLYTEQVNWIRLNFPNRRFTLVFGKDLLGRITDIKLAAGLKGIHIRIFHANRKVMVYHVDDLKIFDDQKLSLNYFKRAFGVRDRILTRKPIKFSTFLEQLSHNAKR